MKIKEILLIVTILVTVSALTAQSNKFKPDKGMHAIIPIKSTMEVKVGEKLYYGGREHGSVGEQVECWSEHGEILKHTDTHSYYDKEMKKGERRPSGGDASTKTFVFEALKAGVSKVMIKEVFRGETTHEYIITITVVE